MHDCIYTHVDSRTNEETDTQLVSGEVRIRTHFCVALVPTLSVSSMEPSSLEFTLSLLNEYQIRLGG